MADHVHEYKPKFIFEFPVSHQEGSLPTIQRTWQEIESCLLGFFFHGYSDQEQVSFHEQRPFLATNFAFITCTKKKKKSYILHFG